MRYFLILFTLLLIFFTACSEKSSPKNSTIYDTIAPSPEAEVSREAVGEGYGGDISPVVMPSPSIAVGEPHPSAPITTLPSPVPPPSKDPYEPEPQSGILTAADVDDNLNLTHFQK